MKVFLLGSLLILSGQWSYAIDSNACKKTVGGKHAINNIDGQQKLSTIRYEDAVKIFAELKNPHYRIPYLSAENHCDLRAHKISKLLYEKYKLSSVKVFLEAVNEEFYGAGAPSFTRSQFSDLDDRNVLIGTDLNGQTHTWRYHTATALCVQKNNKDELYVMDLSLFNKPVPYSEWKNKIAGHLDSDSVKSFSGSMFSLYPRRGMGAPKAFSSDETKRMEASLAEDWSMHLRSIARQSGAVSQMGTNSITF